VYKWWGDVLRCGSAGGRVETFLHTRSIYENRHSFGRRGVTTLNAQLSAARRSVEGNANHIGFKVDP
jgi:hypothetical protein